jgi:hypothetical protein
MDGEVTLSATSSYVTWEVEEFDNLLTAKGMTIHLSGRQMVKT